MLMEHRGMIKRDVLEAERRQAFDEKRWFLLQKKKKKKKFEIEKIYQDGAGINNCYLFFFLVCYMSSTFYIIEI